MEVRFWGVRGSIPVAGSHVLRTGGNTSCIEVVHDGHRLIIDGGTGLRELGDAIGYQPVELTVLFTHTHWDHIQGVPFFTPAYHAGSNLTFAGPTRDAGTLHDALATQMRPPTFPIQLDDLAAHIDYRAISESDELEIGPFRVRSVDLFHPDGVRAYRIEAGSRIFVHATDVEHGDTLDPRLIRFAEGADLLSHDAQYTREEYLGMGGPSRRGWGHATWRDAVNVARAAGVHRLALFHHDPRRNDDGVDRIEAEARGAFAQCFAAREGSPISL